MKSDKKNIFLITAIGILAWFPILNFWFFKAYEATWLTGVSPYNLINLIRGHAFLYFLDLKLFGWNPFGWYLTALVLHLIASILLYELILVLSKNKTVSLASSFFFVFSSFYSDVLT